MGYVTRGKLARESVITEARGRSNSVRSFHAKNLNSVPGVTLYTLPTGKTFIVTDAMVLA